MKLTQLFPGDSALIVRDDSRLAISFSQEANELRWTALEIAKEADVVTDAWTQQRAVAAQATLQALLNQVEKARVAVKAPVLEFGKKIDGAAKIFRAELEAELLRISRAIGDFQTLEQAKVRAAEAAARLEQDRLERERQEAIAKVQSHDELDAINAEFNEQAQAVAQAIPQPVRAEGQIVRPTWEITRINEMQLARARPDLVRRIEFDMRAIKEELCRGVKLAGVEAREVINSGVRTTTQKAIEV